MAVKYLALYTYLVLKTQHLKAGCHYDPCFRREETKTYKGEVSGSRVTLQVSCAAGFRLDKTPGLAGFYCHLIPSPYTQLLLVGQSTLKQ